MGYIGTKPADSVLTTDDIADSIITSAKIADGTISSADLATGVGGKILQVVSTQGITDFTTTSSSFVDVTGASLNITPSATSSKILLMCNTNMLNNTTNAYWNLTWERTVSATSTNLGDSTYGLSFARAYAEPDFWGGVGMTYLDSPSTTSAITYQVQLSASGGTSYFGANSTNVSSIYAMEIGT